MNRRLLTLFLAATAFTAACDDDDDNTGPEGDARVRVVHASPDAPAVDVLLDDAEVLSNVPYLAASDYLETTDGEHNLKVNAAGTTTSVIDADVTLTDGTDYTVIASGLLDQIEPIVLEDDNTAPAAGSVLAPSLRVSPPTASSWSDVSTTGSSPVPSTSSEPSLTFRLRLPSHLRTTPCRSARLCPAPTETLVATTNTPSSFKALWRETSSGPVKVFEVTRR